MSRNVKYRLVSKNTTIWKLFVIVNYIHYINSKIVTLVIILWAYVEVCNE